LLKSDNGLIRNRISLLLRELKDDSVVEYLFEAIKGPKNSKNRSTMVYALETLDCRGHFLDLIELALASRLDVQCAALNILEEQRFLVTYNELNVAINIFDKAKKNNNACDVSAHERVANIIGIYNETL